MSISRTTQNTWVQIANTEGPNGPVYPQLSQKKATQKLPPIPEVNEDSVEKPTKRTPPSSLEIGHD